MKFIFFSSRYIPCKNSSYWNENLKLRDTRNFRFKSICHATLILRLAARLFLLLISTDRISHSPARASRTSLICAHKARILLPRIIKISAMYTACVCVFRRNNYFADNDAAYLTFVNRNDFIIVHCFAHVALHNVSFLEWKIREHRFFAIQLQRR